MKCEKCNEKEATFFYQETTNGKTVSVHLCHDCATQAGYLSSPATQHPSLFGGVFPDLLGELLGERGAPKSKRTCTGCGATWQEIARAGKVFCPTCYTTFAQELEKTLRSLHGNVTHVGRMPEGLREQQKKQDELQRLKAELRNAVEKEDFEKAAELRDAIRAMGEI